MLRSRSTKPIAFAACAAVLAGGGAAAIAQGQSTTPTTQQEIDLTIPKNGMKFIDNKPKGPSTGDRFLDFARVVDAKSGARRGLAFQTCDLAKLGKTNVHNCYGGIQLSGGRINFSDTGTDTGRVSTAAITGGTGAYSTARGTIVFDAHKTIGVAIHVAQ